MSEPTSHSLLVHLKANEPQAWQRIVDLYGALVYYWCRRDGLTPEDAADVSQEVFCGVSKGITRFHHSGKVGSFRAWLRTITSNKICDLKRRAMHRETAMGGSDAQLGLQNIAEDAPPTTIHNAPIEPLEEILAPVRNRFKPSTWQAFWQTAVEEKTPADVADELGMTVGAVYMARSRVVRSLREEFGEFPPFEAESNAL